MKISKVSLLGCLAASLLLPDPNVKAASFSLTPTHDAEIRENNPEAQRGNGVSAATGGPIVELAVRQQSNASNVAIIKFNLAGVTPADVNSGKADLWLHAIAGFSASNPDGIRVYGLNAGMDNNQAGGWNEQTVHYRDSGFHTVTAPQPTQGPLIQLNDAACGVISGGSCPTNYSAGPPESLNTLPYSYGADPNLPTAAPGIAFENAPYSYAAVVRSNGGDVSPAATQPGYNVTSTNATYPDVVGFPIVTRASDDIDASGEATFLGYMNWEPATSATFAGNPVATPGNVNGKYLHFTSKTLGQDDASAMMDHALLNSNESALKAWLIDLINSGDVSATMLLTQKNIAANMPAGTPFGGVPYGNIDPLPGRGDNKRFSSKEFAKIADLSDAGQWAPKLFIGANTGIIPEPSSMILGGIGLGLMTLARRRK